MYFVNINFLVICMEILGTQKVEIELFSILS
jgi:hypothetical protein